MKMVRSIESLTKEEFDLVIIGGGIFGACAAWDAALRGLSVAIIEKGDFSHATSANHFKMVHGGIRYLQHADVVRIRESSRERSSLLRIAPHLVRPLPIVIPTYGHTSKGKAILGAGMLVYDLLTFDRNRGLIQGRRINRGKFLKRKEVIRLFPGIEQKGLTGGALFCDGQMYNPPRVALSFLRSAVDKGAIAANYVEANEFLKNGNRITGIRAKDLINDRLIEIRGRHVLNAAGPWAHRLLESSLNIRLEKQPTFSRDLAMVVNRSVPHGHAVAFSTGSKDSDSLVDRGGRHLFAVPWREHLLIGVWHKIYNSVPDDLIVEAHEIKEYVKEVNQAYPGINIKLDEITIINTGLTLFGEEGQQSGQNMSFGKRSLLIDHSTADHLDGLVTLIGVRATTARGMAAKAIELVMKKSGEVNKISDTENTPIFGGDIKSFEDEVQHIVDSHGSKINTKIANSLVSNYGSKWPEVLNYASDDLSMLKQIGNTSTLKSEVLHAVRKEMAMHLSDVVCRRTDLGTGNIPDKSTLMICAQLMAKELDWDEKEIKNEVELTEKSYKHTTPRFE